jgi:hypothetical protein
MAIPSGAAVDGFGVSVQVGIPAQVSEERSAIVATRIKLGSEFTRALESGLICMYMSVLGFWLRC